MRIYLVRIPHREGHSTQSIVLLASAFVGPGHRIQDLIASWPQREGSQAASRQLRSNNRAAASHPQYPPFFIRFDSPSSLTTIPLTWAEDRALLGSNPSAVPGANTEWGGTRPPSAIRDWHQGAKSRGLGPSPSMLLRGLPSCLRFSLRQPRVLGT